MTTRDALAVITPGEQVRERTIAVDAVDLFLFSAACWLPHRIHYDQAFARSEGLEGTPVHGPLQAAWLCQLAEEWAVQSGGHLVESTVRHVSSVYPGDPLVARVIVVGVDEVDDIVARVELRLERRGEPVSIGAGIVRLPRPQS